MVKLFIMNTFSAGNTRLFSLVTFTVFVLAFTVVVVVGSVDVSRVYAQSGSDNISNVSGTNTINAGVANGAWLSNLQLFVGDQFNIKTAFQNSAGFDLIVRATFFDNSNEIGSQTLDIRNGKLIEISHKAVAEYGDHRYSIEIEVFKKVNSNNGSDDSTDLTTTNSQIDADVLFSQKVKTLAIFIDEDTDGDDVGNIDDDDDDNDGVSDAEDDDPLSPPATATEEVLDKIQNNTSGIFKSINNFTEDTYENLSQKVEAVKSEIETLESEAREIAGIKSDPVANSGSELTIVTSEQSDRLDEINRRKNLKYGQLALLSTASTLFSNAWIFWIGIIILSYLIFLSLRKIVKKLFRKSYE